MRRCIGAACSADYRSRENKNIRVLVVGPTGYIGKFVVKELIKRGYDVVAFAREKSGIGGKASKDDTIRVISSPCGRGGRQPQK
jgi:divinyl chlorophyllide a 8-vinyl-reductase